MTASERLPRPRFDSDAEYGARLGDVAFWAPYVSAVLRRHGLPDAPLSVGTVGSFPTFLASQYVVKLFGEAFEGAVCFEAERTIGLLLLEHPSILAPRLVAEGTLSGGALEAGTWPWPYLVTTRIHGTAWGDADLQPGQRMSIARQLGSIMRQVHALPAPTGTFWERDWLELAGAEWLARHRRRQTLPPHLIDQIDAYLVEPSPARRLVHADLHAAHLFVDGERLTGIIDWGDALVVDPYYELPSLHLGTFGGDKALLRCFLEAYGWEIGPDFARRAMSMTLRHQFDVLNDVTHTLELGSAGTHRLGTLSTLDELADMLWRIT